VFENELRPGMRRGLWQFNNVVTVFCVNLHHFFIGALRFGEVLFAFTVCAIDFCPGRSEKHARCIAIKPGSGFDRVCNGQSNEAGIAKRVWYAAVAECGTWSRRVTLERFDRPFEHEIGVSLTIAPGEGCSAGADLFLNDLSGNLRRIRNAEPLQLKKGGRFPGPWSTGDHEEVRILEQETIFGRPYFEALRFVEACYTLRSGALASIGGGSGDCRIAGQRTMPGALPCVNAVRRR
jgi:hypothetical protein